MQTGQTHLFIPGPTNVPECVRQAMNVPMQDMRASDFGDLTLSLFEDLKPVFGTTKGTVMLFPGSGTAAWEAAITNTLSPGDRVLICRNGHFSCRWIDMLERFGLDVEVIDVAWGAGAPVKEFERRLGADTQDKIKAVFATHNETATGVTSDVAGIRAALDASFHDALLFVDGVSSVGSIEFCMDAWGVDLAVAGTQKGLMCPAGLGILAVSDKAMAAHKSAQLYRAYFDFTDMLAMNKDGYFPYTPPTPVLHGLKAALARLHQEGLENVYTRHAYLAGGVRDAIHAWGLDLVAEHPSLYSNTVSAIRVPDDVDARDVISIAYEQHNTSFGSGLARLAGRVFRIGHLGDLNQGMCLSAIATAEMALIQAGYALEPGCGVAAAQRSYLAQPRNARSAPQAMAAE